MALLSASCHPNCIRAMNEQEDYDASQSAAMVAVNLISSARLILKLDTQYTEYSAQFLVDNACPKKEDGKRSELTVKDALAFALKEGLPKEVLWAHLGCTLKPPPSACHIPRVSMKGKVVEAKNLDGAFELLMHQPVGAKLHVFSPEIDRLGDGIFDGPSCNETRYVGLRDVIIVSVEEIEEDVVAIVKICYKKKTSFIKLSLNRISNRKMTELLMQSISRVAGRCHPDCVRANDAQEDYDASQSAALVAVNLISSARVILKLDSEYTEYSAQFLVDNAGKEEVPGEMDQQHTQITLNNLLRYMAENVWTKKEGGDQQRRELTVKDCLECAFKKGLPRREHWAHVGCTFKAPPFACHIPRVPMKGEVIEAENLGEACKLLRQQPVGARLHVFSPEIDRVGEGIYDGMSGNGSRYVGLRDVIIVSVEKFEEDTVAIVKICYKKKTSFIKVSLCRMFSSQDIRPTLLLVDFCVPRLSIK